MSGTDYTLTPNLQLYKPIYDQDVEQWGNHLNANADVLDKAAGNPPVMNVMNYGAKGDGTTDDTAAIQTVINNAAGKAVVLVPWTPNGFRTKTLNIPSITDLWIQGKLQALPGLTAGYINCQNVNNIIIRGQGIIDANGAAQTNPGGLLGLAGLAVAVCGNVHVYDVTITNAFFWNVNVTQSNHVMLERIFLLGGGAANEFAADSGDCWLINSTIDGTNNGDYGFCFYGGVHDSGAIGNVVSNTGANTTSGPPGIGVMNDTAAGALCSNIVIANNVCHDCAAGGITILGQTNSINTGIIVANNRCYNNCRNSVPAGQIADCFCDNTNGLTITGNQFGSGLANAGIFLGPGITNANIIGNQVHGMTGGGNPAGIWHNSATNVFVSGNYFYSGTTAMSAVVGTLGTKCVYTNNFFDCSFNAGVASDSVVANYSPGTFSVTAGRLGVGYSPVAYTNTAGTPRWYVGNVGNTENGANTGSDFAIYSVVDAGSGLLANPILITRSTGVVTLAYAPIYATLPTSATNDAAAATAGVPVGGTYRNGSQLMVRVS